MATTTTDREFNQPDEFRHIIAASRKRLFAVFDDPQQGIAAVSALPASDLMPGEQTWLLHGEEGRRRIDVTGTHHGAYGRFVRLLQLAMSDDNQYIDALDRALRSGALVVAVPIAHINIADRVAKVLETQSGHTFAYTKHMDFVPTASEI
jgi:hypothetical protein